VLGGKTLGLRSLVAEGAPEDGNARLFWWRVFGNGFLCRLFGLQAIGYLPVKREAEIVVDWVSWRALSWPWLDLSRRWNSASMKRM
jgi:hypothetical protein